MNSGRTRREPNLEASTWSLAGYKEFALYSWFSGQPGSVVYLEMYFNQYSAAQEKIVITPGGIVMA